MKFAPLGMNVLLRVAKSTGKISAGGIIIPDNAQSVLNQDQLFGVVEDCGPGITVDGEKLTFDVTVGDKVLFSATSGTKIGDDLYLVPNHVLLAIVTG